MSRSVEIESIGSEPLASTKAMPRGTSLAGARGVIVTLTVLVLAGFGLRFLSARSAFGNVAHVDFAFPLNYRNEVRSVQFLITTKTAF